MKQLISAIALAAGCWFLMFSSQLELTRSIHTKYFWIAMVTSTALLASLTLVMQRKRLSTLFEFKPRYLLIGVLHAALLYGLSRLGVYIFSQLFDWTTVYIQSVYATRSQLSPMFIAPMLMFIIAPCEEIFWRGFVQERIQSFTNSTTALLITVLLYSLVHIWALNPMLLIAAVVLGLHWGLLFKKFGSLIPGIISHALWDTTIFVLLPITF